MLSFMRKLNVLALLTERKSNNIQILSVARMLSQSDDFHKKHVYFNSIIKLPNMLLSLFPVWLTVNKSDTFNDVEACDVIVTCGRRSLRYAKHVKEKMFPHAKIIQILRPDFFTKGIDLVMLPDYDKGFVRHKNIVRYHGSLCEKIPQDILDSESERFKNIKNTIEGPYIAVFIGGSSMHFHFSRHTAEELARRLNIISNNMKMPLLIITNKRTSVSAIKVLKEQLDCGYYFYEYNKNPDDNPYYAFLNWSSFNIVTGDSISTMSEVLAMEKPTYTFTDGVRSSKYNRFHSYLLHHGCARELRRDTVTLEEFKPKLVNNLSAVTNEIIEKLDLK